MIQFERRRAAALSCLCEMNALCVGNAGAYRPSLIWSTPCAVPSQPAPADAANLFKHFSKTLISKALLLYRSLLHLMLSTPSWRTSHNSLPRSLLLPAPYRVKYSLFAQR